MPRIQSVKKALRGSQRKRAVNVQRKTELKTVLKEFKKLAADKKTDEAKKYLSQVYKKLDKSAKINLIKKNKANRLKSRLSKIVK